MIRLVYRKDSVNAHERLCRALWAHKSQVNKFVIVKAAAHITCRSLIELSLSCRTSPFFTDVLLDPLEGRDFTAIPGKTSLMLINAESLVLPSQELAEVILQTFVSGPFIHEAQAQFAISEPAKTEL